MCKHFLIYYSVCEHCKCKESEIYQNEISVLLLLLSLLLVARSEEEPSESLHLEDHPEEEVANEVSANSFRADELGNENLGDVTEDHSSDMYNERGVKQDFSQGGSTYNKHHKGNVADNKELENVKQHDAGEKFGAEALKEHKLGKHKEKSKGHKLHGFKNTYHKEEYGDHKTFHDEFLDTDHHHDYDDHHEHRQLQGGKFSKGFKQEGKNKNFDAGDEKHEWGKDGYDGYDDGKYEAGSHASKHHHGNKKHEEQHESHDDRQSYRKKKNGGDDAPHYYSQDQHTQPHHESYDEGHYEGRASALGNKEPRSTRISDYERVPPLENSRPYYNHEKTRASNSDRITPLEYNEPQYNREKPITRNYERVPPLENDDARYNPEKLITRNFERVPPLENNDPRYNQEKLITRNFERVPPLENNAPRYNPEKPITGNLERVLPLRNNELKYNQLQAVTKDFMKVPLRHNTAKTYNAAEIPQTKVLFTNTELVPRQAPIQHQFYHRWPQHPDFKNYNPSKIQNNNSFPKETLSRYQQGGGSLSNNQFNNYQSQPYRWPPANDVRQPTGHQPQQSMYVPQYS
ncbi:uncharacterized protein [Parasteatoda tepidariorum]|uniref:uncharacterized protein isoform X2 n=1 Tax=Parasteatoda tepidariorum TaxID=114398 RepID=UPI0039BCC8A5